ncbi:MAG: DUF2169 domain-containing protein [Desulfuromonadales bacterium]
MLQLKNSTPFIVGIALFPNEKGIDTIYVTAKATFAIKSQGLALAEKQLPLLMADQFRGEPENSSLAFANETLPTKPFTNIVLVGSVHAPGGRPVPQLDVTLQVGPVNRVIKVFGDRQWIGNNQELKISPPIPFSKMPLEYERAFGGMHETDPVLFEERNPVGKGFSGKRTLQEMAGRPLPNFEDPAHLIRLPGDRPMPVGLGYISPTWEPRKSLTGTYDAAWTKQRAPYLPEDFNPRFFNTAHPELICKGFLKGGEPVYLQNLSPAGSIRFTMPLVEFDTVVYMAGSKVAAQMNMDTVLIVPDEERISVFWRTGVECDKKTLKVSQIDVALKNFIVNGEKI